MNKNLYILLKNVILLLGCNSVGECFNPSSFPSGKGRYGELGSVTVDNNGRANFRLENKVVKLSDVIGRSLVITEGLHSKGKRLTCGIIARSSGLFQNPKTICACDGVSIWDERNKPKSKV